MRIKLENVKGWATKLQQIAKTIKKRYSYSPAFLPKRTTKLCLPANLSVFISRILLTIKTQVEIEPQTIPKYKPSMVKEDICKKIVPSTAIGPKKTSTKKSAIPK